MSASAPGKVILCGEHAVVYGHPAIAVPVTSVAARATVKGRRVAGTEIVTPDLDEQWLIDERPDHPLSTLTERTLRTLGHGDKQALRITLESTIPIASGMGSGAAIAAALVRGLGRYFAAELDPALVSRLVYESERHYHGTPSGIDNSVVSYGRPIWFQRSPDGAAPRIEPLPLAESWTLVIGDTGLRAPTRLTVGAVRERRTRDPQGYDALFAAIGQAVATIRQRLLSGAVAGIGPLLDQNHHYLQAIGVSTPELDRLVLAARAAGATGAKLSGGGGGGIMLATANAAAAPAVARALRAAGAARVIVTEVAAAGSGSVLV